MTRSRSSNIVKAYSLFYTDPWNKVLNPTTCRFKKWKCLEWLCFISPHRRPCSVSVSHSARIALQPLHKPKPRALAWQQEQLVKGSGNTHVDENSKLGEQSGWSSQKLVTAFKCALCVPSFMFFKTLFPLGFWICLIIYTDVHSWSSYCAPLGV